MKNQRKNEGPEMTAIHEKTYRSPAERMGNSPRRLREWELARRQRGTSTLSSTIGERGHGVLQRFMLIVAFQAVSERLTQHAEQTVTRKGVERLRWTTSTKEKAIATAKSYFYGGDAPHLLSSVTMRVMLEFALECVERGLTDLPGQSLPQYNAYQAVTADELKKQLTNS